MTNVKSTKWRKMLDLALQQNIKRPLSDLISSSFTFLRTIKSEIVKLHFSNYFLPNSILPKLIFVDGLQAFSGTMGMPREL